MTTYLRFLVGLIGLLAVAISAGACSDDPPAKPIDPGRADASDAGDGGDAAGETAPGLPDSAADVITTPDLPPALDLPLETGGPVDAAAPDAGAPADAAPDGGDEADASPDTAPDVFVDAGPVPSRCPVGLLCDGFERPALDPSPWFSFQLPPASTIAIDPSSAARGASALRFHAAAGAKDALGLHWTPASGALPRSLWLRFFLWVPADAPAYTGGFVTFDNGMGQEVALGWSDKAVAWRGAVADASDHPDVLPRGRWTCALIKLVTGTAADEISLSFDGNGTALRTTVTGAPALRRLMFAFSPDGSQQQAVDFLLDEVALSDAPLDCTN